MATVHGNNKTSSKKRDSNCAKQNTLPGIGLIIIAIQLTSIYFTHYHDFQQSINKPLSSEANNNVTTWALPKNSTSSHQQQQQVLGNRKEKHIIESEELRTILSTNVEPTNADGIFSGMNVYLKNGNDNPMHSTTHCIGENYIFHKNWFLKSCEFRNLCFNLQTKKHVLFQSPSEIQLQNDLLYGGKNPNINDSNSTTKEQQQQPTRDKFVSSITTNHSVSIGGINPKWTFKHGVPRLRWFPDIIEGSFPTNESYYELPSNTVWITFHSLAGFNPGHLMWDDLLPLYTLLSIFQLLPQPSFSSSTSNNNKNNKKLLLSRFIFDDPLWATCDFLDRNKRTCKLLFRKFLPLLGISNVKETFNTIKDLSVQPNTNTYTSRREEDIDSVKYVCSPYGAAGLGPLTDHGFKLHGWEKKDYESIHNHGRGNNLYEFRNWMINNYNAHLLAEKRKDSNYNDDDFVPISTMALKEQLHKQQVQGEQQRRRRQRQRRRRDEQDNNNSYDEIDDDSDESSSSISKPQYRIIFSTHSSNTNTRSKSFKSQIMRLKKSIANDDEYKKLNISIEDYTMKTMSLEKQLRITSSACIFITVCGGGAVTAQFLPAGSSIIIYYDEAGGIKGNRLTGEPALLDWDLFNNMAFIRSHWLPFRRMDRSNYIDTFVNIVKHELDVIRHL